MTPGAIAVATPVPDWENKGKGQNASAQQLSTYQAPSQGPIIHHADPTISRDPLMMKLCPNCHQESRTRVSTYPTWQTWCAAAGLLFVFWPVAWVPLVVDNW
jgi:LITAF-like zinc ribbon domain